MKQSMGLVVLMASTLAVGCGVDAAGDGQGKDVGSSSDRLIGAPLDSGDLFAVGVCTGPVQADGSCTPLGTPNTSRCSGTLVAPNVVVTARHCIERIGAPATSDYCSAAFTGTAINNQVEITTNSSVYQTGSTWYQVQSISKPDGTNNCTDDIAVLTLGSNVPNVDPASANLVLGAAAFGSTDKFTIVGRGAIVQQYDVTTMQRIAYDDGHLERRKLENIPFVCTALTPRTCSVVDYSSSPPVQDNPPGFLAYGPGGASGDSGAGVLLQGPYDSGSPTLIAVHTTGTLAADGNFSAGQGVLLQPHADMIRKAVQAAAKSGGYQVPCWATLDPTCQGRN